MMASPKRSPLQVAGVALAAVIVIPLTVNVAVLLPELSLAPAMLLLLFEVVLVGLFANIYVSLAAALGAVLLANWYLVPPTQTFFVSNTDDIVVLMVFILSAVGASLVLWWTLTSQAAAAAAEVEAVTLRRSVATPADEADPVVVLDQIKDLFDLADLALVDPSGVTVAQARGSTGREPPDERGDIRYVDESLHRGYQLMGYGPMSIGFDRGLIALLGDAAVRSYEARQLARDASRAEELAAADRARSALLASVGHDLRTPIAAIGLSASALKSGQELSLEDRAELVDTIAVSAHRLNDLVENLLDMSRLEAGHLIATIVPTSVDESLAAAAVSVGSDAVKIELDEAPLSVMADPGLLERVLVNLLSNSLRHTPTGMPVLLSAHRRDDVVRLMVVDHGPGIDPADHESMFRPFQRARDGDPGGVGLGLAIARGFTEAMSGTLMPLPTPGGGLTMAVDLPVAP